MAKKVKEEVVKRADKKRTVDSLMADLSEKYKRPMITMASDVKLDKFPTGLMSLDEMLCGGIPKGRWTMLYGAKGVGKSSLVSFIIGKVQEAGLKALYIDAEHAYDPDYGASLGVDNSTLLYVKPQTLEEAITVVRDSAPVVDLIVVDSIVAIGTEKEIERDMEQDTMAAIPRKLSQFFRITNPIVGKSNCMVILINQTRSKLDAYVPFDSFPGGNALAHYCSFIMSMRRGSKDDDPSKKIDGKDVKIGHRIYLVAEKTKLGPNEAQKGFFDLLSEAPHFDDVTDLAFMAELKNIITGSGAWFYYGEQKFSGRAGVVEALRTDSTLFDKVREDVLKTIKK